MRLLWICGPIVYCVMTINRSKVGGFCMLLFPLPLVAHEVMRSDSEGSFRCPPIWSIPSWRLAEAPPRTNEQNKSLKRPRPHSLPHSASVVRTPFPSFPCFLKPAMSKKSRHLSAEKAASDRSNVLPVRRALICSLISWSGSCCRGPTRAFFLDMWLKVHTNTPMSSLKYRKCHFCSLFVAWLSFSQVFSLRKTENSPKARTNDKNFTICHHPSVQNAPLLGRVNLGRSPQKLSNHSFHDIRAQFHANSFMQKIYAIRGPKCVLIWYILYFSW